LAIFVASDAKDGTVNCLLVIPAMAGLGAYSETIKQHARTRKRASWTKSRAQYLFNIEAIHEPLWG